MANIIYTIGKRLLISERRAHARGSVIFILTHVLFFAGVVFTAEIALILLGMAGIHVSFTGQISRLLSM